MMDAKLRWIVYSFRVIQPTAIIKSLFCQNTIVLTTNSTFSTNRNYVLNIYWSEINSMPKSIKESTLFKNEFDIYVLLSMLLLMFWRQTDLDHHSHHSWCQYQMAMWWPRPELRPVYHSGLKHSLKTEVYQLFFDWKLSQ